MRSAPPKSLNSAQKCRKNETTGRRYVGSCQELDARLTLRNRAECKATSHGVPWILVYHETLQTRGAATQRERYFKTGKGRDELISRGV